MSLSQPIFSLMDVPMPAENRERPAKLVAAVPDRLQAAMAVLVGSEPNIHLIAASADIQTLLLLHLDQPPDLVLLEVDEDDKEASRQIRRVKAVWPQARCIALVELARQREPVRAAGADIVLVKGVAPRRLMSVIMGLWRPGEDEAVSS